MTSAGTGQWRQTLIGGKTADIFEPFQPAEPGRALLHLHGFGLTTLKDNPVFSQELDRHGMRCVCPHGQRSWWLDRICREFDPAVTPLQYLRNEVAPWIERSWNIRPPAIGVSGNSMGGQGALQLAYRWPREFPVVAAICPAIDFQQWHGRGTTLDEMFASPEAARQETAVLRIRPLDWPRHQMIVCDPADHEWFDGADRIAMKMSSMGVPFEQDLSTSHGGHTWEYVNAMARPVLQFIADRLDLESRRL